MSLPDVVFCHGMWCHAEVAPAMERTLVRAGLRYHKLDLPDHGTVRNGGRVGGYSMRDYARHVEEFIAARGLRRPVLVGHSMGGLVAQMVASRVEVAGLVLLNSVAPAGVNHIFPRSIWATRHVFSSWPFWSRPQRPPWPVARYGLLNELDEPVAREVHAGMRHDSGRAYSEIVFWWLDRGRTITIDRPVSGEKLIFASGRDRIIVPHVARCLRARYPEADYVALPDNGHWIFGEAGDQQVYQRIVEWIRRLPMSRAAITEQAVAS